MDPLARAGDMAHHGAHQSAQRVDILIGFVGRQIDAVARFEGFDLDTGIGIEESFVPLLFDEFEQESSGLSRSYEGSGLGLSITARLVKLMDGTIHVESQKGQGSVFTVSFPMHRLVEQSPSSKPNPVMAR